MKARQIACMSTGWLLGGLAGRAIMAWPPVGDGSTRAGSMAGMIVGIRAPTTGWSRAGFRGGAAFGNVDPTHGRSAVGTPSWFFIPSTGRAHTAGGSAGALPRFQRYYEGAVTSCRPSRRTSFPSLGGAFALLFDPGRAVHIRPLRCGGAALVGTTTKAPTTGIFEAPSHSFSTGCGHRA